MALIECPECGKVVSQTAEACPNCGYAVKKHFDEIAAAETAEKRKAESAVKRQQRNKVLKIIIPIALIVVGVIVGIIINNKILSERTLFSDDKAMMTYLTNKNCWKLDDRFYKKCLTFYSYNVCSTITENYSSGCKIKLNPGRGYFDVGHTRYIISSDGNIIDNDAKDIYKPNYTLNGLEDGIQALDIEVISAEVDESGNFKSEYKITNNGKVAYEYIRLETVVTYDDGEQDILTDFEMVESENDKYLLKPGNVGTAHAIMFSPPKKIVNATGYVTEYMREFK